MDNDKAAEEVLKKIIELCDSFDADRMKPEVKEPEAEESMEAKDASVAPSDFGHQEPESDEDKLKALAKKK